MDRDGVLDPLGRRDIVMDRDGVLEAGSDLLTWVV